MEYDFTNSHLDEKQIMRYLSLRSLSGDNKAFSGAVQKHLCECGECLRLFDLCEKLYEAIPKGKESGAKSGTLSEFTASLGSQSRDIIDTVRSDVTDGEKKSENKRF